MVDLQKTPVDSGQGGNIFDAETLGDHRWTRAKRVAVMTARTAFAGACMLAGGYVGVAAGNTIAPTSVSAGALSAKVTMQPTVVPQGGTEIPTQAGSIILPDTHHGASVDVAANIDGEEITALVEEGQDPEVIINNIEQELQPRIGSTVIETAGRSTAFNLGGNIAGLLIYAGISAVYQSSDKAGQPAKISRRMARTGIAAVALATAAPYCLQPAITQNSNYGQTIEYTGLLSEAEETMNDLDTFSRRFNDPLTQLLAIREITENLREQPELQNAEICLYLYADSHGGGYRLATELNGYDETKDCIAISVVLGDLVDWGQSFENSRDSITQLPRLKGQVLVVKGNHDSRNTMNAVGEFERVTDLGKVGETEVAGIRFVGITDPTFTPTTDGTKASREAADEQAYQAGVRKGRDFTLDERPIVLFAHRDIMLSGFFDGLEENPKVTSEEDVNVILVSAGHTHELKVEASFEDRGITYVNPGSSSGGMFRLTDPETGEENQLSAATVYIVGQSDPRVGQVVAVSEDLTGENRSVGVFTPPVPENESEGSPSVPGPR